MCPFCAIDGLSILAQSAVAVAIRDRYPLTSGHTLVVPRVHVASIFELAPAEHCELWQLVDHVRSILADAYSPAGFTIGMNDGLAAGQTVSHAHVHVIPRYEGDVPDPRGGIRWVIPQRAAYWEHAP
jgi:diadenosine tetraphosphate (Ap4A) HIT family hydrolase